MTISFIPLLSSTLPIITMNAFIFQPVMAQDDMPIADSPDSCNITANPTITNNTVDNNTIRRPSQEGFSLSVLATKF